MSCFLYNIDEISLSYIFSLINNNNKVHPLHHPYFLISFSALHSFDDSCRQWPSFLFLPSSMFWSNRRTTNQTTVERNLAWNIHFLFTFFSLFFFYKWKLLFSKHAHRLLLIFFADVFRNWVSHPFFLYAISYGIALSLSLTLATLWAEKVFN